MMVLFVAAHESRVGPTLICHLRGQSRLSKIADTVNLYPEDLSHPGEANVGTPGPIMYQVGTEGGFLPAVAVHNNTTPLPIIAPMTANPDGPFNLLLAPAERADVVIDFNGAGGQTFILYNDSVAPFPSGDGRNEYFTGAPNQTAFGGAPTTLQGFGPNTRTLMKIVVTTGSGDSVPTSSWLSQLNIQLHSNFLTGNQPGLLYNNGNPAVPGPVPYTGPVNRQLTLNEDFDDYGRLIQTLGTFTTFTDNQGLNTWGSRICQRSRRIQAPGQSKSGNSTILPATLIRSISTWSTSRSSSDKGSSAILPPALR
jgi:spore coat protein A, manganese oxidase